MKLFICDHLGVHKTTKQIEKWMTDKGHEVKWNQYYDPRLMDWCDVAFYAWTEGMLCKCLRDGWGGEGEGQELEWNFGSADAPRIEKFIIKKKPIFSWAVDIEVWARQGVGARYDQMAGLFYMSEDIFAYLDQEVVFGTKYQQLPIYHLPLSIDVNDWTYRERSKGKKIAVIGEMWMAKNPYLITQMLAMLPDDYTVDVLGKWNMGVWRWTVEQFWHEVREYGLEGRVTNILDLPWGTEKNVIDEWLEDKDYLVTFSAKDAFSIIVAEAMAKGIKALPHNFIGSRKIWGKYVWNTLPELVSRIQEDEYNSQEYRDYVVSNYSNEVVLPKLEEVLNASIR